MFVVSLSLLESVGAERDGRGCENRSHQHPSVIPSMDQGIKRWDFGIKPAWPACLGLPELWGLCSENTQKRAITSCCATCAPWNWSCSPRHSPSHHGDPRFPGKDQLQVQEKTKQHNFFPSRANYDLVLEICGPASAQPFLTLLCLQRFCQKPHQPRAGLYSALGSSAWVQMETDSKAEQIYFTWNYNLVWLRWMSHACTHKYIFFFFPYATTAEQDCNP